jgi:hypothetical protein
MQSSGDLLDLPNIFLGKESVYSKRLVGEMIIHVLYKYCNTKY